MTCGIYQILNTVNGKSYVGLSRNIEKRWRQHTGGLDKPSALERGSYPLRSAFLKYGLKAVVSTVGRAGVFEFKVIEKCTQDKLLEREQYWIEKIQPQYNCNVLTPAIRKKPEKSEPKFWIQYHNYDNLGYLPAEALLNKHWNDEEYEYDNAISCVSTDKRSILNAQGDTIFLIVGIGNKPKQYYLWSRLAVEEVETINEARKLSYHAFGNGCLIDPPQLLNSPSFNDFRKFCGNFGLGFMSINNYPYLETLKHLSESHKPQGTKLNFFKYIENFYKQVTRVNPNEVAAYSKRGLMRPLAVSLPPDDAAALLAGIWTTLVVFEPTDLVIKYKGGKLLIHTLEFPDHPQLAAGCKEILAQLGVDEETFPAFAIQGWATVDKIIKYDPQSFAADKEAHGRGNSLIKYQAECGLMGRDAWGIVLKEPVVLDPPIYDVFAPEEILEGDLWSPLDPSQIQAFKLALETPLEDD